MKEQNIHLSLVSTKFTGGFNSQVVLGYYIMICYIETHTVEVINSLVIKIVSFFHSLKVQY